MIGDQEMAELEAYIAHGARPKLGLGHSYSYGYRLASGT